jgi:hypothetical protein
MKNAVFWDITPCGSCKDRHFEERIASIIKVTKIGELGTTLAVNSNGRTLRRNTLMMEALRSSETSVLRRTSLLNSQENDILQNNVRREVFTAVTMKNDVFWDIKTQFVPHRQHITSPLQSSAG